MDGVRVIGMVEAAYRLEGDETEWLCDLVAAMLPALDHGMGVYAYTFDLNDPAHPVSYPVAIGPDYLAATVYDLNTSCPPEILTALHGSRRPYATVNEVLSRSPDPRLRVATANYPVAIEGREPAPMSELIWDCIGVNAANPDGTGVIVAAPLPRPIHIAARDRVRFGRVAAHIAAALRLRRALAGEGAGAEEAVLAPDGACLHAEGPAKPRAAREDLRRAARAIDRARGPLRREQDRALGIWRSLCAGRWTLLDRFESDGRRFLIARENAPSAPRPRALTERERQVVALAALGHTNKLVAYCLGLSPSMVAAHLKRAMGKLGVSSRLELIQTCRALGGASADRPE